MSSKSNNQARTESPPRPPLSKAERTELLFELRKAFLERGYRQVNGNNFLLYLPHGTFRIYFTAVSCERQIQRCDFSRKGSSGNPDPYWWEDIGFGWLNEMTIQSDPKTGRHIPQGFRTLAAYKGMREYVRGPHEKQSPGPLYITNRVRGSTPDQTESPHTPRTTPNPS